MSVYKGWVTFFQNTPLPGIGHNMVVVNEKPLIPTDQAFSWGDDGPLSQSLAHAILSDYLDKKRIGRLPPKEQIHDLVMKFTLDFVAHWPPPTEGIRGMISSEWTLDSTQIDAWFQKKGIELT